MRLLSVFLAFAFASVAESAPAPTPSVTANAQATNAGAIDLPVPVGEPVKGIKIPQYDENGKLSMNLSAETARKLDETKVELQGLKVSFCDPEGKEMVVEIPHSYLDLGTRILTADTPTTVSREDFDIIGETAVFDTATRSGSFKGHVKASFLNKTTAPTVP